MRIRALDRKDAPAAALLLHQLGYATDEAEVAVRIAHAGAAPDHHAVVAELDGRIVGRRSRNRPRPSCRRWASTPRFAARASGGRSCQEAEGWARARRLTSIALHTRADRDGARTCYTSLGYATAATAHLMRKPLGA
jgi:hypothetical protein